MRKSITQDAPPRKPPRTPRTRRSRWRLDRGALDTAPHVRLELDVERRPTARQQLSPELAIDEEGRPWRRLEGRREGLHGVALTLDDRRPQPAAADLDLEGRTGTPDGVRAQTEAACPRSRLEAPLEEPTVVPCVERRGDLGTGLQAARERQGAQRQ